MNTRNIGLIFRREVIDQLRDRRTLFMIAVLPLLLYPALGFGMMQLTVLFSEQPRVVVILGARNLPAPPLVVGHEFAENWFRNPADAGKLEVTTDAETNEESPSAIARRDDLLAQAATLRERLDRRQIVQAQLTAAELARDLIAIERLRGQLDQVTEQLGELFNAGEIQVLIVIPDEFSENLARMKQRMIERTENSTPFDYPRPVVLQNSADEKSLIAANRVQQVLDSWEREILRSTLSEVGLPTNLPAPVDPDAVDLAQKQQISANVWSKLFPALLVIMSLTGAFYPAIDLGAGEKERGTMETLLICPASRTEIVLGKFLTVMLFSSATALLNIASLGFTGRYMMSIAAGGAMTNLGDLTLPPLPSLAWVLVMLAPLSALFSALCLSFATFARSSKEGQYYLTPLLMVTLGLTVFCLSPAVEIQPFYSVMPVMGPALLLKGLLLGSHGPADIYVYVIPVLATSIGYSILALWWAIDQFGKEEVLFREAERFDLRLWLRHLLRAKEPTPSFSEATFCFVLIMLLQFLALKYMQVPLRTASASDRGLLMMQLLIIQQLVIVATPPLFMGIMLTSSVRQTFRLRWPALGDLVLAALLALVLHPVALELGARTSWFFPALPSSVAEILSTMTSEHYALWIPLLAFAFAPAVCEEVAFRGFLLSGFLRSGRTRLAIVLSSLTFGIMHMIPQQVFNASLLGLVLGLIAVRTNSLLPGIMFHFCFNAIEVLRGRFGPTLSSADTGLFLTAGDGGIRYTELTIAICVLVASCGIAVLALRPDPRLGRASG